MGEFTIFENVKKVLPGEILQLNHLTGEVKVLGFSRFINASLKESLRSSLARSIKNRLNSDVEIASLISGGVDSTILTYELNKIVNTTNYFIDFDDKKLSEGDTARRLACRNGLSIYEYKLTVKDIEDYSDRYYDAVEEPFADYSLIPSLALFNKVSQKHRLVFSGDGGDELFYGYPHYRNKWIISKLIKYLLSWLYFVLPISIRSMVKAGIDCLESSYLSLHAPITDFAKEYIDSNWKRTLEECKSVSKAIISYDRKHGTWPDKYLVKVDRASMFSGVEVRSPFMDERLEASVEENISRHLRFSTSSKVISHTALFQSFWTELSV